MARNPPDEGKNSVPEGVIRLREGVEITRFLSCFQPVRAANLRLCSQVRPKAPWLSLPAIRPFPPAIDSP